MTTAGAVTSTAVVSALALVFGAAFWLSRLSASAEEKKTAEQQLAKQQTENKRAAEASSAQLNANASTDATDTALKNDEF